MKSKVLLINPSYQPHWSRCEPTGLLYIASYLEERGIDVKLLDLNIQKKNTRKIISYINDFKPGFVGISLITRQALRAYRLGKNLKKSNPNIRLIYGGVHPTLLPDESFQVGLADYVVIGEGEKTTYELIKKINNHQSIKNIKGICYRYNNKVIKTNKCDFLTNLDILPFPDYSLVDLEKYNSNIHIKKYHGRTIHMFTSRGCTESCYYCCSPTLFKRHVRFRSVKNVVKEIEQVINRYSVKNIHFHDDNFLIKPKRVIELCNLIKKKKLSFKWICLARADVISQNPEILPIMKDAGCVGIEFGVEAGDDYVLGELNKNENLNHIYLANKYIKQNDIYPMYLIISYSLGENIDSSYKTAKLYYELKIGKSIKKYPHSKALLSRI